MKILIGESNATRTPIYYEPNNPAILLHPNMGILGTMGTGKTQLLRSIIAQLSKEGCHNVGGNSVGQLIFDYKGDYNDKDFIAKIGADCLFCNFPFNPLKLIITERNRNQNLPSITAERIADSLAKAYSSGPVQQNRIKEVIVETYEDYGITRDSSTWNNTPPSLKNVIDHYLEKYDASDTVYALFSNLNDFSIFDPNPTNCVSIFEWLNGPRIIDLTEFPEVLKKVVVALILDIFNTEMLLIGGSRTDNDGKRELRAMIVVDEAHQFLQKNFLSLESILRQGRMFGVGMILSTQNACDFKTKKQDYSQYILSWAIHKVNVLSNADLVSIFGNSDPNLRAYSNIINNAEKFHSVVKLGNKVYSTIEKPYFKLIIEDPRFH